MSILKQPFDRYEYDFDFEHKGYSNIEKRFIIVPTGENSVSGGSIAFTLGAIGAGAALSFLWLPLALIALIPVILWIAVPGARPIVPERKIHLYQNGTNYTGARDLRGPAITWSKAGHPLYKEAIADWLDEVRQTDNLKINHQDWTRYFARVEKIINKQDKMMLPSGPDFDRLKVLEELMESEK